MYLSGAGSGEWKSIFFIHDDFLLSAEYITISQQ